MGSLPNNKIQIRIGRRALLVHGDLFIPIKEHWEGELGRGTYYLLLIIYI